jgi:hypothetical protein
MTEENNIPDTFDIPYHRTRPENAEINQARAQTKEWQEANLEGAEKRVNDPHWQANHREVLDHINSDPTICQKRLDRIQEVTSTKEWKEAQLNGIRNIRDNNPDWAANISAGHEKLRQTDEYWKQREEVGNKLKNDPNHGKAVKEGVKDRWNKPENLSDCPHCGMIDIDNANYALKHGDRCWLKDKKLIGYDEEGVQVEVVNITLLEQKGFSKSIIKERIRKGGKHKKLFWKLETK